MAVDIIINETKEEVLINVTPNVIEVNITRSGGMSITKTSDLENDGSDGINPFISLNEIPSFEPNNYDLVDFNNSSTDPFVRESDIPIPSNAWGDLTDFNDLPNATLPLTDQKVAVVEGGVTKKVDVSQIGSNKVIYYNGSNIVLSNTPTASPIIVDSYIIPANTLVDCDFLEVKIPLTLNNTGINVAFGFNGSLLGQPKTANGNINGYEVLHRDITLKSGTIQAMTGSAMYQTQNQGGATLPFDPTIDNTFNVFAWSTAATYTVTIKGILLKKQN